MSLNCVLLLSELDKAHIALTEVRVGAARGMISVLSTAVQGVKDDISHRSVLLVRRPARSVYRERLGIPATRAIQGKLIVPSEGVILILLLPHCRK
jgi:hypothetical protein